MIEGWMERYIEMDKWTVLDGLYDWRDTFLSDFMVCIPIPCPLWGSRSVSALLGRCREHCYQFAAGGGLAPRGTMAVTQRSEPKTKKIKFAEEDRRTWAWGKIRHLNWSRTWIWGNLINAQELNQHMCDSFPLLKIKKTNHITYSQMRDPKMSRPNTKRAYSSLYLAHIELSWTRKEKLISELYLPPVSYSKAEGWYGRLAGFVWQFNSSLMQLGMTFWKWLYNLFWLRPPWDMYSRIPPAPWPIFGKVCLRQLS